MRASAGNAGYLKSIAEFWGGDPPANVVMILRDAGEVAQISLPRALKGEAKGEGAVF